MNRRHFLCALGAIQNLPARQHSGSEHSDISAFESFRFQSGNITHPVYWIGSGPPILLLHELPGLMPEDIHFACLLSQRGYTVYVPLLFGKPGDGHSLLRDKFLRVVLRTPCWGGEFNCASNTSLGGITAWAGALAREIIRRRQGGKLAVMGNCMTGSLPLALMADEDTRPVLSCAVISQPALPLGIWPFPRPLTSSARMSAGLTDSQMQKAVHSGIPILAFRFVDDPVVPGERLETLAALFRDSPGKFEFYPVIEDSSCKQWAGKPPSHHHSVLTVDTCEDADTSGAKARERAFAFLAEYLPPSAIKTPSAL